MQDAETTRRRFIFAAIALSGAGSALGIARAWAQADDGSTVPALADLARRLYPHAALDDSVYTEALDYALARAVSADSLNAAFDQALAALNGSQSDAFAALNESEQIAALQRIEDEPFFAQIQGAVLVGVYNHPALWELVGYGGPSFAQGGYLNRGAGEIDWLEESN